MTSHSLGDWRHGGRDSEWGSKDRAPDKERSHEEELEESLVCAPADSAAVLHVPGHHGPQGEL